MKRALRGALVAFLVLSNLNCTVNILESFANKETNEAYLVEAKRLINDGDYDGALNKLALITGAFAADRSVITLKASAHAGKCGLNFLSFVEAFQNLGTSSIMQFLLAHFVSGTAAKIDSCISAEDLVESIGSISERTDDENLLLALISFAKIGTVLSLYTDSDDNGTVDGGYDTCAVGASRVAGNMTTADVRQVGTGITLAVANIGALAGVIDLGGDELADINAACSVLNGLAPALNFCTITDPTAFTADHLRAIRGLLRETSDGIGLKTCVGGVAACVCP